MDVIALVKEGIQSVAEHAASYKIGQTALRHVDRALWVVENCARWAVPPPLDPEESPQPELVRPLPWVFFLMILVTLRVTRESISLVNLVLGKPPLRSADVVTYIQSKRRYLRTLKYQGNRMMRARTSGTTREPWHSGLRSLFEFTMCFRRQSLHYGNNNTTTVSNNDEVLVVKRSKRPRQQEGPVASTSEASMERLIEKMMVDLDADSDEDSSYTLTNATSVKSDGSVTESDLESANDVCTAAEQQTDHNEVPKTPEPQTITTEEVPDNKEQTPKNASSTPENQTTKMENQTQISPEKNTNAERERSPARISEDFLQNEKHTAYKRSPKKQKIANGRTVKSTSERNIGGDKRPAAVNRAASVDFATREKKENNRQTP